MVDHGLWHEHVQERMASSTLVAHLSTHNTLRCCGTTEKVSACTPGQKRHEERSDGHEEALTRCHTSAGERLLRLSTMAQYCEQWWYRLLAAVVQDGGRWVSGGTAA